MPAAADTIVEWLRDREGIAEAGADLVRLDAGRRIVVIDSHQARLKKTAFRLFAYLVQRAGGWVGTDELRAEVLQTHFGAGASNIRWHVLEARRALGCLEWCLHSCRRGYMFKLGPCDMPHCERRVS